MPTETGRINRVNYPVIYLLRDLFRDRGKVFGNDGEHKEVGRDEIKNHIFLDQRRRDFAILPQSAAAELGEEQTNLALDIFFDSIRHLKMILPSTKVEIIYLPSVVTVYEWDNPVYVETYHTNEIVFTTSQFNLDKSRRIRSRVIDFANLEGVGFIDTCEELMAEGRKLMLHGPLDLRHLNEIGQRIVGETIHRKELGLAATPGR